MNTFEKTKIDPSLQPSDMVAEFQIAFETSEDPELWKKLIREEVSEAIQAIADLLKELQDVRYVQCGLLNMAGPEGIKAFLKEDKELFTQILGLQAVEELLFPREVSFEAFVRVHNSNMSKLGDDGKPVRREDGKVMKGPNYKAPELRDLIA